MEPFFTKVKFFRFCPKTMDYNKAFWPKSRSFFAVLLLENGRCYEAEICTILLLLRCPFRWNPFFAKVKIFRFWPKTMDYNKAFWPKSRSLFVVLLLQNERCYEAEICAILLLLRCPFRRNPFLDFGQKPWTIIRCFTEIEVILCGPFSPKCKVL